MFELIDMLIVRPITNILFVIYGFVGDFGLAIILFTILVKICLWPLAKRQLHQTRLMRKIQPELAEIKKNCNGNRQLESLQMMDLYKRNNIKPFRSMLTLLIQLPIFIALYTAVRVMVLPTADDNLGLRAYAPVRQIDQISEVITLQDTYLADPTQNTYDFHPKLFGLVELDLKPGLTSVSSLILLAFAIASAFTQYWISRQQLPSKKSQKSRTFRQIMKDAADGKEPDQAELNTVMTGQMSKIMPVMMLLVMINLPGALVFYYLISNLMTGIQQKIILSRSGDEMERAADQRVVRELNRIEEAQIVEPSSTSRRSSKASKSSTAPQSSKSSTHITRISAKSKKHRFRKP